MKEHVDRDRLVELTRALVAVDTSNPPGNEVAVSDILRDTYAIGARPGKKSSPHPGGSR